MKFLSRALTGFVLFAIAVGFLVFGAMRLMDASKTAASKPTRPPVERSYSVDVASLTADRVEPTVTVFGEVLAWRSLELRAPAGGAITRLNPLFRDGQSIDAGATLLRIDPGDANTRVAEAGVAMSVAQVEQAEAKSAVALVASEIKSAERQLELRRRELERQNQLLAKGLVARAAVETAELAVSSAEQALVSRQQQLLTVRMRVDNAALNVQRAKISVDDSDIDLDETTLVAPFAGRLDQVAVTAGRRVGVNEKLGVLIDPSALEVKFSVRDEIFGRLVTDSGALAPLPVEVELTLGSRVVTLKGELDRDAAVVNANDGGRTVFARLESGEGSLIRPGDFVSVTITELPLENVTELPAGAITQDGRIFLVNGENRLEEVSVDVVRRLEKSVVVRNAPIGKRYVTSRLPQLGNGIKVKPRGDADAEPQMVRLDDARRQRLVEGVKANRRMPERVQARMLKSLANDEVPADMVKRLESRMGITPAQSDPANGDDKAGARPAAGEDRETVELAPERREKLMEFVKTNTAIPEGRRTKMLERLAGPRVPKAMIERIESQMGG